MLNRGSPGENSVFRHIFYETCLIYAQILALARAVTDRKTSHAARHHLIVRVGVRASFVIMEKFCENEKNPRLIVM